MDGYRSPGLVNDHLVTCFQHPEVTAFACSLAQDVLMPEHNFVPVCR